MFLVRRLGYDWDKPDVISLNIHDNNSNLNCFMNLVRFYLRLEGETHLGLVKKHKITILDQMTVDTKF